MRPHAYGGYCALDNNLPKPPPPPLPQPQPQPPLQAAYQNSQHKNLAAAYARSQFQPPPPQPLPPPAAAYNLQHHHTPHQQLPNLNYHHNQLTHHNRNLRAAPPALHYKHHVGNFSHHAPPQPPPAPPTATPQNAATTQNLSAPQRLLPTELANAHNYAKLPPPDALNQQRIHECAGIPLISASFTQRQQQRLQRKPNSSNPLLTNQAINCHWQPTANNCSSHNTNTTNSTNNPHTAREVKNAGQQILLPKNAPFWSTFNSNHSSNNGRQLLRTSPPLQQQQPQQLHFTHSHLSGDKSRLCYQHSAPPALSTSSTSSHTTINHNKENLQLQQTPATASSNSLPISIATGNSSTSNSNSSAASSTNDELSSKDSTENCLPRIIKPRKRRKKDRKPANGVFLKLELELEAKTAANLQPSAIAANAMDFGYLADVNHKPNIGCLAQYTQPGSACFCSNCNPLRSIWEYPLRRSYSDSSNASTNENFMRSSAPVRNQQHNDCNSPSVLSTTSTTSSTSTNSTHSSKDSATSSSSSATTVSLALKNENFSPITIESTRANIVGVIGSNRAQHQQQSNQHELLLTLSSSSATSSYEQPKARHATYDSDISNGYCGDILSGINLADDLFKNVATQHRSSTSSTSLATSSSNTSNNDLLCPLLLPTSAAERLLTASINEISRQLIETCINEPNGCNSSSSIGEVISGDNIAAVAINGGSGVGTFSTCSDLSNDSGLDSAGSLPSCDEVVFKFDDLNLNFDANEAQKSNMIDVFLDFNNNNVTTLNKNEQHLQLNDEQQDQHKQQFTQNCYELMWRDLALMNNNKNFELTTTINTNAFNNGQLIG